MQISACMSHEGSGKGGTEGKRGRGWKPVKEPEVAGEQRRAFFFY